MVVEVMRMRLRELFIDRVAVVIAFTCILMSAVFAFIAGIFYASRLTDAALILAVFSLAFVAIAAIKLAIEWSKTSKLKPGRNSIVGLFLSSKGIVYFKRLKIDDMGIVYNDDVPIGRYNPGDNVFYLTSAPSGSGSSSGSGSGSSSNSTDGGVKELGNPLYLLKDFGSVVMLINENTMSPIPKSAFAKGEVISSDVTAAIRSKIDLIYRMVGAAAESVNKGILSAALKSYFSARTIGLLLIVLIILFIALFAPMLIGSIQSITPPVPSAGGGQIITPR